jgi:hypothetical protein
MGRSREVPTPPPVADLERHRKNMARKIRLQTPERVAGTITPAAADRLGLLAEYEDKLRGIR